ncbi:GntR family transcriptional regulator [Halomonas salipaludis]|uniref:GntR family transcriptional regulator n=1 Tax=Halomonas salipaludis TaxID=2032625 RepID=A0A2A2EYJ7_9GAMM|nr:FCD domain-containing protein [Halomonas salipaludis]PAU77449.1 GntR family transcriptional regulator [Halomonas salipaludis]
MALSTDRPKVAKTPANRTIRAPSLTELAFREIEGMIITGELETGERINDSQLAKRFGISRGPVREAIGRLAAAGLVEMIQNRGAYVRVIDVEDALEIYDIRAALERAGVAGAARNMSPELLARLREQVATMDRCEQEGDREGYFDSNLQFHRIIHEAAGNARLLELCERFARELKLFRHLSLITAGIHQSNQEHHQILAALEEGDANKAADAMEAHVWQAKARLVALAESLKGKPHDLRAPH